jgi:hypothetical protein
VINFSQLSVSNIPTYIKDQYNSVILISSRSHLSLIDTTDEDTLIVTSDWLSWIILVQEKAHAIHFEAMVSGWNKPWENDNNFYLDSCNWMYRDKVDITVFRNVSLGRHFNGHIASFRQAFFRMWQALDQVSLRFNPKQFIYYELRSEYDFLSEPTLKRLVNDVAARHNINVTDLTSRTPKNLFTYPVGLFSQMPVPVSGYKNWLRSTYCFAVDLAFKFKEAFSKKRPRVPIHLNWIALKNIIEQIDGTKIAPLLVASYWPKSLKFVIACWKKGVVLTRLPSGRLNKNEIEQIRVMTSRLMERKSYRQHIPGEQNINEAIGEFIETYIIKSGWLEARASEVKSYDRLFDCHNIARVLVGHAENMLCRTYIELAAARNIESDELLNGLFLTAVKTDSHCTSAAGRTPVTRLLTWGQWQEKWLENRSGVVATCRTGYPAVNTRSPVDLIKKSSANTNALILPLMVDRHDLDALFSNTFSYLVETAAALKDLGYKNIRVKLHPGYPVAKPYLEEIFLYFGLDIELVTKGPFEPHMIWADVIIGPINSGAFVESLGHGKLYLTIRSVPSSLDTSLFGPTKVYDAVAELKTALEGDIELNAKEILNWFCDTDNDLNSAIRVWQSVASAYENQQDSKKLAA